MSDEQLMGAALEQAALGLDAGELPIGSVAAVDGEILARAFWRRANGLLAHPELLVLQQTDRRGLTLYTTLEPCLLCMAAAMFGFAERIVFALESPTDGGTRIGDVWDPAGRATGAPYAFPAVVEGICRAQSVALIQAFLDRGQASPIAEWARTLV